jgi:dTMP kinase
MVKKGVFCVFEGIDGSGKTYHIKHITEKLNKLGYNVLSTKEPNRSPIGEFLHRYVRQEKYRLLPKTEAYLFTADRMEHVKKIREPALARGRNVITDRARARDPQR